MNKELFDLTKSAFTNTAVANFSTDDINSAAINALLKEAGITDVADPRILRDKGSVVFSLVEEVIDEILPKKLENVLGAFAEVKTFARNAEVVFNIDKIGKNRAKLTIAKGARGGIYRAAKLDSKYFSVPTQTYTVAVYATLEELILGTVTLSELFNNILEGLEEIVYKEIFNALATGAPVAGYDRVGGNSVTSPKADLPGAIDKVLPVVKQYGMPTIFGSYQALSNIYNPLASATQGYPNIQDSMDVRERGFVQVYKGVRVVELPNYLVDNSNETWFYDPAYVFVMPSGVQPVKVALKGQLYIQKNVQAVGSEKWEAHKIMGVGLAMANNFAVIKVSDLED